MILTTISVIILTIILFIFYRKNNTFLIIEKKKGIYRCNLPINGKIYEVTCEVELVRNYEDGDVIISYDKIYGLPEDLGDTGIEILINDFSVVSMGDVEWIN